VGETGVRPRLPYRLVVSLAIIVGTEKTSTIRNVTTQPLSS
jgi:hypothetical protein